MTNDIEETLNKLDAELGFEISSDVKKAVQFIDPEYQEPVTPVQSKANMILHIRELEEKTGISTGLSDNKLKRLTKNEVSELLGQLLDKSMNLDKNEEIVSQLPDIPVQTTESLLSLDVAAESLFNLNKLFASALSAVNISCETGYDISGYSSNLDEKKSELLPLYKAIYEQHKLEISRYISPVNLIVLLNGQCLLTSVVRDAEKN